MNIDFRAAVRGLTRNRTTTLAALVSLVLGIAINTAVFSVIEGIMFAPLPYRAPDQLLGIQDFRRSGEGHFLTPAEASVLRERLSDAGSVGFYRAGMGGRFAVHMRTEVGTVDGYAVDANVFRLLGIPPELGRPILAEDDAAGSTPVVVIGHSLWQHHFGGRSMIGTRVWIDDVPATVVGIMPPEFWFPSADAGFWTSLATRATAERELSAVVRTRPGVTRDHVQSRMESLGSNFDERGGSRARRWWRVISLDDARRPSDINFFFVLQAIVGCVLLAACANVSSLFMVRAISRRRELVVRAALGGTRWDVARPLVIEAGLIVSMAFVTGALAARTTVALLASHAQSTAVQAIRFPTVNLPLLGFLSCAGFVTLIACVIGPVRFVARTNIGQSLRDEGVSTTGAREGGRHRAMVVGAQLTVTLIIVAVTCTLVARLRDAERWIPPYALDGLYDVELSSGTRGDASDALRTADRITRLEATPGITGAGASHRFVPTGGLVSDESGSQEQSCTCQLVTTHYLSALGVPVLRGRGFRPEDLTGGRVAVVDETLAQALFGSTNAVGHRIRLGTVGDGAPFATVVGIISPASLTPPSFDAKVRASGRVFVLAPPESVNATAFVVRSRRGGTDGLMKSAVRAALPIDVRVTTVESTFASRLAPIRSYIGLVGALAALALVLGLLGLTGTLGHIVSQRTREIGVRSALGATPLSIGALVFRSAARIALPGLVAGTMLGWGAARIVERSLFASDGRTLPFLVGGVLAVCLAAIPAVLVPAVRAVRISPASALRQ